MQQVPAVDIDGITLSQSVSPRSLYRVFMKLNLREVLKYEREMVSSVRSWQ